MTKDAVAGAGNFLEGSRLNPPPAFVPRSEFREFRPRVRMWPAASSKLLTSVTVTAAKSYVLLQANPCTWEEEAKPGGIYTAPRVPFAQVIPPSLPVCMSACRGDGDGKHLASLALPADRFPTLECRHAWLGLSVPSMLTELVVTACVAAGRVA